MTPDLSQTCAAVERLRKEATPGEWKHAVLAEVATHEEMIEYATKCIRAGKPGDFHIVLNSTEDADVCHSGNGPTSHRNAAYIVAACNAAPALVAALREAERREAAVDALAAAWDARGEDYALRAIKARDNGQDKAFANYSGLSDALKCCARDLRLAAAGGSAGT